MNGNHIVIRLKMKTVTRNHVAVKQLNEDLKS